MSDHPELAMSAEQIEAAVNTTKNQKNVFRKAVRAVGFLEGFSTWLWTHVGPDLADEAAIEYERNVAKIADYLGLPPREEQDASDGC